MHGRTRSPRPVRPTVLGCAVACVAVAALLLIASPRAGHAEQEAMRVHYPAGWNIVAAPTGTELRGVQGPQYSFGADGGGYATVHDGELIAGRAVWAFFPATFDEALGRTPARYTRQLVPANQWELVGNPSSTQTLPIAGADDA